MSAATVVLSWFRASFADGLLIERMERIRGHRLSASDPTVRVFLRKA